LSGATFVALFIAALVIWLIIRVVPVLLLVFLAVLLAVYFSTITDALERRFRVPRPLGLTIALVGTLAAVTALGALLMPPVRDQTRALLAATPQILTDAQAVVARWAGRSPLLRDTELADPQSGIVARMISDAADFLRGSLLPYLTAGGIVFIEAASVLVMALYFARQPALYAGGLVALIPPRHRDVATRVLVDAGGGLRDWVGGQLLAMSVLAVLTAIGLWILGVPYWLAFGLFTGLVAIVPFFGTMVSTLLPAIVVLGSGDALRAVLVLALGVVVHIIEANFVAPLIMHRSVALPPALTIACVLVMGVLLGAIGLVVAVPLLVVTFVVVRQVLQAEIYREPHPPGVFPR